MAKRKILLAGESWVTSATHYKGFDQFGSVTFHRGATALVNVLKDSPFELVYMPAHEAAEGFPFTPAGLADYEAIIPSDIGSNTFLLPSAVWMQGKPMPNRLRVIRDWTRAGFNDGDHRPPAFEKRPVRGLLWPVCTSSSSIRPDASSLLSALTPLPKRSWAS